MRLKWLSFIGGIFTLEFVGFSNCQVKGGTSESCFGKPFRLLSEDPGTRSWEGEGRSRGDNPPGAAPRAPRLLPRAPRLPPWALLCEPSFPVRRSVVCWPRVSAFPSYCVGRHGLECPQVNVLLSSAVSQLGSCGHQACFLWWCTRWLLPMSETAGKRPFVPLTTFHSDKCNLQLFENVP